MKMIKVDVAVLGAGTAGLNARRAAEKEGAKTVVLDGGPFGTTCARTGCMPSKLMISAGEAARAVRGSGRFGINAKLLKVQSSKVMQRVRLERDRFTGFVLEDIRTLKKKGLLIPHPAVFVKPGVLQAGPFTIQAKAVVIATGTSSVAPEPYQLFKDKLLTHESVFELKRIPRSLLIVGAGVIGLELGQALQDLGSRVTVLGHRQAVGPLQSPEVRKEALRIFGEEMDFFPEHTLLDIKRVSGGLKIRFLDYSGRLQTRVVERVLIAAGRRPNLDKLQIKNAGISLSKKGAPNFNHQTLQAGKQPLFLAGDVNGFRPVLHEATQEGRMAGFNAARFPKVKKFERLCPLIIIFTNPQIAVVGKSFKEIQQSQFVSGSVDYARQGRARIMGINRGKVEIYGDPRTGKILGAEMLGPRVEHTAHLLAWAVQNQMRVQDLLRMPFYHPVIEEGIETALMDLASHIRRRGKPYAKKRV